MKNHTGKVLFLLFWIVSLNAQAQYQIQLFPNSPLVQNGVWGVNTWLLQIEGSGPEKEGFLVLEIMDSKGRIIFESRSGLIVFSSFKQARSFNSLALETVSTDSKIEQWMKITGCLPEGMYLVRVQLFDMSRKLLAEEKKQIAQTSGCQMPLHLISPGDKAQLRQQPLTFQWTTPFRSFQLPGLTYHFQLAEQLGHQSREQAMLVNPHIFQQETVHGQIAYPPYATQLETGHTYTWMVIAYWEGRKVGQSQVWSFSLLDEVPEKEQLPEAVEPIAFFKMGDIRQPPDYILDQGVLGFYFKSSSRQKRMQIKLSDNQGNTYTNQVLVVKPGLNYSRLDLRTLGISKSTERQRYRLDLLVDNKPIESLFFQF
jgi:hypothetical protein